MTASFPEARKEFDEMLDRVEAAQRGTGEQTGYGPIEWIADVEITNKFVAAWWDMLQHREQVAYAARIVYLQALGKGIR